MIHHGKQDLVNKMKEHHPLHKELAAIVGSEYVSDEDFVLLSYTRDISDFPGKPQGIVVRPSCVEDVVEIVKLANLTRTAVIPMGGKASLCGVPPGQPGRGIIVDMRRMNKIICIDEENQTVTAECGIMMGELAGKLNEKGWDILTAAQPHYVVTVGGHLSGCVGAGFSVYGFSVGYNWTYVLGLKVVLPNGSVIQTGMGPGSFTSYRGHTWTRALEGPDTTGLFIGDGGIFGIKIEATYKIFRLPKFKRGACYTFESIDDAYRALSKVMEIDTNLYLQPYASCFMTSPETINFMTMGMAPKKWTALILHIGNSEEEIELKAKTTDKLFTELGGTPGPPAVRDFFTEYVNTMRDMGKVGTMGMYSLFEFITSKRDILKCMKFSINFFEESLKRKGIDKSEVLALTVFLPCGPNFGMTSIIPFYDPSNRELGEKLFELQKELLETGASRGYWIEASQSWESLLKAKYWSPELYNYILTLKKTLDPNNIMNPGIFFG